MGWQTLDAKSTTAQNFSIAPKKPSESVGTSGVLTRGLALRTGTSRIYTLARMQAATSGLAGKSLMSPWRMAHVGQGSRREKPRPQRKIWDWGEACMSGRFEDTKDMLPARHPHTPVLAVRGGLEHGLHSPSDRRDRTGLPQPRAATRREEHPIGLPGIPP